MSEYQYYEFQAVDRPLSKGEIAKLRSYSTRARITPGSFVNEYSWGDLKGDPDRWMEKYFDAFLYVANWGTHTLKLRLPTRLLAPELAKQYCKGDSAESRVHKDMIVISFSSQEEGGDYWIEAEGMLSSMISSREELARGDLRALYLGWLLCAQNGELDDQDIEPPVPPGLGKLSASLKSLAEFLRIEDDIIHVAAQNSPPLKEAQLDPGEIRVWVSNLPDHEKNELISDYLLDGDLAHLKALGPRLLKEMSAGEDPALPPRRTVGELLGTASAWANEKARAEAERLAKKEVRRKRAEAAAREQRLDSLAGKEASLWARVENLIDSKLPKSYDEAVNLLLDLRDLDNRKKGVDFGSRIEALHRKHARKPTLIERLLKAGL
jgi:hypothetical protein